MFRKILSLILSLSLLPISFSFAQNSSIIDLPKPGKMIALSPAFTPAKLQGMVISPNKPFQFDFIMHQGDLRLSPQQKKDEYTKLIQYFLAALAVDDKDQWVNLSPYEKDRIIPETFGQTQMGNDLLAQDYILKQISASLLYPEGEVGKQFWSKVYAQAGGKTNVPINTFNKVWIIPDKATVYEKGNTVYVLENHLRVMLEEDYLANRVIASDKQSVIASAAKQSLKIAASPSAPRNDKVQDVMRNLILPELEKEVNAGKNFAPLRQVYSAMLLATWYKRTLKETILAKVYANKGKIQGMAIDPQNNQLIYEQYVQAFKKGVFNYIKEDVSLRASKAGEAILNKQSEPKKYFAGGTKGYDQAQITTVNQATLPQDAKDSDVVSVLFSESQNVDAAMGVKRFPSTHQILEFIRQGVIKFRSFPGGASVHDRLLRAVHKSVSRRPALQISGSVEDSDQNKKKFKGVRKVVVHLEGKKETFDAPIVLKVLDVLKFELNKMLQPSSRDRHIVRNDTNDVSISETDEKLARSIITVYPEVGIFLDRSAGHTTFDVTIAPVVDRDEFFQWLRLFELGIFKKLFIDGMLENLKTQGEQGKRYVLLEGIKENDPFRKELERFLAEHIPGKSFVFIGQQLLSQDNITPLLISLRSKVQRFDNPGILIEVQQEAIDDNIQFTRDEIAGLIDKQKIVEVKRQIEDLKKRVVVGMKPARMSSLGWGVELSNRFLVSGHKGEISKAYYETEFYNRGLIGNMPWRTFVGRMDRFSHAVKADAYASTLRLANNFDREKIGYAFSRMSSSAVNPEIVWHMLEPFLPEKLDYQIAVQLYRLIAEKLGLVFEVKDEQVKKSGFVKSKFTYWLAVPWGIDTQELQRKLLKVLVNLEDALQKAEEGKDPLKGDQVLEVLGDLKSTVYEGVGKKLLEMMIEEETSENPILFQNTPPNAPLPKYFIRDIVLSTTKANRLPTIIEDAVILNWEHLKHLFKVTPQEFIQCLVAMRENSFYNGRLKDPLRNTNAIDAPYLQSELLDSDHAQVAGGYDAAMNDVRKEFKQGIIAGIDSDLENLAREMRRELTRYWADTSSKLKSTYDRYEIEYIKIMAQWKISLYKNESKDVFELEFVKGEDGKSNIVCNIVADNRSSIHFLEHIFLSILQKVMGDQHGHVIYEDTVEFEAQDLLSTTGRWHKRFQLKTGLELKWNEEPRKVLKDSEEYLLEKLLAKRIGWYKAQGITTLYENGNFFEVTPEFLVSDIFDQNVEFVLDEILKNAFDAYAAIHETGSIALRVKDLGDSYTIEILDNGIGIDFNLSKKLKGAWDVISNTGNVKGSIKEGGIGIGVLWSQFLVQIHGGEIEFLPSNEDGYKTLVKITLPRESLDVRIAEENISKFGMIDDSQAVSKGGIDMNPNSLDMHIKRDDKGMVLPVANQDLENMHIDGLVPMILSITPVSSTSIFTQLTGK